MYTLQSKLIESIASNKMNIWIPASAGMELPNKYFGNLFLI